MKIYTPKEYESHAQNWCIAQDRAGFIYVGNTIGLIKYDGRAWESIKLNNSIVRSLGINYQDKVFYGAQDDFGFLMADNKGKMKGQSLKHLLPDSLQIFGDVWKTYCYKDQVIFQTFDYVFIYKLGKISVHTAENYFHFGYQRNADFFIIDREIGLKKLVGNSLQLVNGGDFFADCRIYGWINFEDYALIATREKGLFKLTFREDNNIQVQEFHTEIDRQLNESEVYHALLMSNGTIGWATLNNGYYITDREGRLIEQISKTNGLNCDIIKSSFQDKQHGLWLAMDVGIARIEINDRFSYYNEDDGLEGITNTVINFHGSTFAGTTKGLFEINFGKVKRVADFNDDVRHIAIGTVANKNCLLVSTFGGLYQLNENRQVKQLNNENAYFALQSKFHNKGIYIGTDNGLCMYDIEKGTTKKINGKPIPEVRRLVEQSDSVLWLGTSYSGVFKVLQGLNKSALITSYDTSDGLLSMTYNLPFNVDNQIYFSTYHGVFRYDLLSDKLERAGSFNSLNLSKNGEIDQIYQIIEAPNHLVWLFRSNESIHEFILYDLKNKQATYPLKRMGMYDAFQCIFPQNDRITWFGGPDGLFRFDASKPGYDSLNFKTRISAVYIPNDTLFGGYWGFDEQGNKINKQVSSAYPQLPYINNNINFEFAALSFDNEKENLYSYYLEGFDRGWSDWTSESKKSYTNLYEGTYTFHVKSKNVYGKVGEEDTYTFTILPPWYRTTSAYLIYAIGAVMMVYVITQLSTRRLKRAKEKLEAIVISRTAEVVAEKEEVEKQKKIVEVKNKDITDSINYAQKIQQAILPLPDEFNKVFPQSFIYFQPRDIVSGDFYWFYPPHKMSQNHVYLAAADCTGHGVPGAFMSMIGNTLLNEILNEKQVYECDAILNQLHNEVRAALKQDIAQNTTNDGMDIALCRIDLDTLEMQYAGANRALYIFRPYVAGYEFIEVKPNKFSIGGFQAETSRQFNAHTIQLKQGDTFYMFSDGYADQFGGAKNKKFMVKRLQHELMGMQHLPLHEQKLLIDQLLHDWKGNTEQVDDILMIGVRV